MAFSFATVAYAETQNCAGAEQVKGGDHPYSLQVQGHARSYFVHVPESYTGAKPVPVVVVLHGGYGRGKDIQHMSQMDKVADANNFLTVYPDGLWRSWNAGGCCGPAMDRNIDDVGFVSRVLDDVQRRYCVDTRRVYATGFSNGSMLAHRLACDLPERIAAIATVSGVIMVRECRAKRPLSVLVFHGTADPRSLWQGGIGDKNPKKGTRDSIPTTMSALHTRYRCVGETTATYSRGNASCSFVRNCDGGNEVGLCKIEGGGHQWPGGKPVWPHKLGPISHDISASAVMWEFFQRHTLESTHKEGKS